jgi:hypothetical protein
MMPPEPFVVADKRAVPGETNGGALDHPAASNAGFRVNLVGSQMSAAGLFTPHTYCELRTCWQSRNVRFPGSESHLIRSPRRSGRAAPVKNRTLAELIT